MSQLEKVIRQEKVGLLPLLPCPVDVFRKLKVKFGIEGFCSGLRLVAQIGRSDRKGVEFHKPKVIAKMKAMPQRKLDHLEPRPWFSWNDCFIRGICAPVLELRRFEECSFAEIDTISALDDLYGIIR